MPLDVIGDEIVLDGQVVGKLLGRAAETTTLNEQVSCLLRGKPYGEIDLDPVDDDDIVQAIHDRDLHERVVIDMSDEELEDAIASRQKAIEARKAAA